ncbi:hypothetical protein [Serinibacter salmoneus]|uniref:hypothetical protein n=1 Tax=Serinibacter salmoneus TaxID=556530 RepID=UPI00117B8887|nr:hypothetical protein [Serinibacter salmoneus]
MGEPSRSAPFDAIAAELRGMRLAAGDPSFGEITARIARLRGERGSSAWGARPGRVTVYDAFRDGRRRVDPELVADITLALGFPEREQDLRSMCVAAAGGRARSTARPDITLLEPAEVPEPLIGRAADLDHARDLLTRTAGPRRLLITGMPGVGKSAFALRLAEETAREAGAQVVRVSLRTASGDEGTEATDPAVLLRQLRDHVADMPRDRGLVVVLDDATDRAGLARFAMGLKPTTTLIATSRRRLADAMTTMDLPPLTTQAACELLARQIDAAGSPVQRDPGIVEAIAAHCGGLPLAVAVVAGQIAARPGWLLSDHLRRLEAIDGGLAPALEEVLDSLEHAPEHVLSLLAIHPGPLTAGEVAVSLRRDLTPEQVDAALGVLRLENLVHQEDSGTLVLHDVVRAVAADRAVDRFPASQRTREAQALASSLAQRLITAIGRAELTSPPDPVLEALFPPTAPEGSWEAQAVPPDPQGCRTWLAEHIALAVTTAQVAADEGLEQEVTALAASGMRYLLWRREPVDAYRIARTAMHHGAPQSRMYFTLETSGIAAALNLLDEADAMLATVAAEGDLAMRIEATAQRALNEMWKRHLPTGIEFARTALAEAQTAGLTVIRQSIASHLMRALVLSGDPRAALAVHEEVFGSIDAPGGYHGVVSTIALAEAHVELAETELALAALDAAQAMGDGGAFPAESAATLRHRLRALQGQDSSRELEAFGQGAANESLGVMAQVAQATTDRIAARSGAAVDLARRALAADPPENMNPFRVSANALAFALVLAEGGDPAGARAVAQQATRDAREHGVHLVAAYGDAVLGLCAALEGDPCAHELLRAVLDEDAASPLLRGWVAHHLDPTSPPAVMRALVVP